MQKISKDTHPGLFLLADHLDAALALGEDLQACRLTLAAPEALSSVERIETQNRALATFVAKARTLEMALLARLLQARKWADDMRRDELGLKPIIALFIAGTAQLADHISEVGDPTNTSFETGNTALAFLRSRALIEQDEVSLAARNEIAITDEYLLAGLARLGTLLDLVATFLDTLDLLGDLRLAETPLMAATVPGEVQPPLPN